MSYYELCPYPRTRLSIDHIHSAEVSTLYPHHGTHGLVLPFGWTNDVPTNPVYCMTLSRPLRQTPLWAMSWVTLCPSDTCHRHGQTNCPKRGPRAKLTWVHKVSAAYRAKVALPHNLPWLEAPARGMTIDQVRAAPSQQVWLHWWARFGTHYDSANRCSSLINIRLKFE